MYRPLSPLLFWLQLHLSSIKWLPLHVSFPSTALIFKHREIEMKVASKTCFRHAVSSQPTFFQICADDRKVKPLVYWDALLTTSPHFPSEKTGPQRVPPQVVCAELHIGRAGYLSGPPEVALHLSGGGAAQGQTSGRSLLLPPGKSSLLTVVPTIGWRLKILNFQIWLTIVVVQTNALPCRRNMSPLREAWDWTSFNFLEFSPLVNTINILLYCLSGAAV